MTRVQRSDLSPAVQKLWGRLHWHLSRGKKNSKRRKLPIRLRGHFRCYRATIPGRCVPGGKSSTQEYPIRRTGSKTSIRKVEGIIHDRSSRTKRSVHHGTGCQRATNRVTGGYREP